MALNTRRIVTGHDADGKSMVKIDGPLQQVASGRPGAMSGTAWTTHGFPVASNDNFIDEGLRETETTLFGGTVFRLVEYMPGVSGRNHRTDSIDYGIVISGDLDMELDTETVHLHAGDVVIQRGTIHNWINNGSVPCTVAFVLIDATPVKVAGQTLEAKG